MAPHSRTNVPETGDQFFNNRNKFSFYTIFNSIETVGNSFLDLKIYWAENANKFSFINFSRQNKCSTLKIFNSYNLVSYTHFDSVGEEEEGD